MENLMQKTLNKVENGWNICTNNKYNQNGRICLVWESHIQVTILDVKE